MIERLSEEGNICYSPRNLLKFCLSIFFFALIIMFNADLMLIDWTEQMLYFIWLCIDLCPYKHSELQHEETYLHRSVV